MFAAAALILFLQDAPPQDAPALDPGGQERLNKCVDLAARIPAEAEVTAGRWRVEGGGYRAQICLGVSYANQKRWVAAAGAFEDGARAAENARDPRVADYWAMAGNAWLAAGNAPQAKLAFDAALATGTLRGERLGEAYLDRGRARVAIGDLEGARADLDRAVENVPRDPIAWLLSATLARRMNDPRLAKAHIDEALRRSPDDPRIQLEAGNVAVVMGDQLTARSSWERVIELAPGSPEANDARAALGQLGVEQ